MHDLVRDYMKVIGLWKRAEIYVLLWRKARVHRVKNIFFGSFNRLSPERLQSFFWWSYFYITNLTREGWKIRFKCWKTSNTLDCSLWETTFPLATIKLIYHKLYWNFIMFLYVSTLVIIVREKNGEGAVKEQLWGCTLWLHWISFIKKLIGSVVLVTNVNYLN